MITVKHLEQGYAFLLDGEEVAVGEYDNSGSFMLIENDDITQWTNAMLGLSYLRRKFTPKFYTRTILREFVEDKSKTTISRYKGHIALQTIDKETFHAWELKNGSRRSKN